MFGKSPIPALILVDGCGFCLMLKTNLNPIKSTAKMDRFQLAHTQSVHRTLETVII